MRLMKAFPLGVLAGALLCSTVLLAQHSTATPRITANVDELSLTTLKGNVPRLAQAQFDQGEAASSTQLTHIRLVLSRSTEQQAALDSYLAQLQDKSSPNYQKWLTPEQFGQLYGPADSDIAALVAWLESHGLQVETVSKGRTNIAFNGTVSQVEQAFHTSIHSFQTGTQQFYSNTTEPQIPSALAGVVMGVAHLNTIRPRPYSHRGIAGQFNPQTKRLEPASVLSADGANPNLTTGTGTSSNPYNLWLVPGDAATIYDTPNSYNANFSSGTSYTGAGVNIGVGGDATINSSTVVDYRSRFLGNTTAPTFQYCSSSSSCSSTPSCTGGTSGCGYASNTSDDGGEAYLDTELSGGMAPGATIYYYASTDLYTGIEAAIDANLVNIFSLSWGDCESNMGGAVSGTNAWFNNLWSQAATQGIAVTVSSGDSGSAGCDVTQTSSGANVPDATGGLAVSGFASTPYNIAVGGTDFYALPSSFTTYASITNEGSASNNYDYYRTALSYIPESTWNDSTTQNGAISGNIPLTGSNANIWSGSGGVSAVYSRPAWQVGTGAVDSHGMRDLPDVSLMAGSGTDSAAWLVCTDGTYKSGSTTYTDNCVTQSGSFSFAAYGGTSTAAPSFAGILALVQQKTGSRLGQAAQELYTLYNGSHASSIFHDVTVGNNSVPCTPNLTKDGSCVETTSTSGYYSESGYNTTTGYDLATGMGSVDATQLVNYWGSSSGSSATFALAATPPSASITPGGFATSTITVSSGTLYTGTITLTSCLLTPASSSATAPTCSITSGSPVTMSSGTASGTATATVTTTPASAALAYPKLPGRGQGNGRGLSGAGGGAVLAFLLFLGIPARRRNWRSMLGVLLMMAALGSLAACGGGGSTNTGSTGTPGTSAGTYTFTVTGTGSDTNKTTETTTFTVNVS
jgi:subtilase family serine protease